MKIIFLGTPEFAVITLQALVNEGFHIVAVVTAPDKPAGRGMELQQTAVKKFALQHGIPVLQPLKLKDPGFLSELKSYGADIQVVVAFRMLPVEVWNMPPLGSINLHASLLPQYRGAAPINHVLINGEKTTGITTFRLQHEIDTGDILLQEQVNIREEETAGSLHDILAEKGAQLMITTLKGIESGTLKGRAQETGTILHKAPKIFPDTCRIDWQQPVHRVHNLVRGLSPSPAAFCYLGEKKLKIFRSLPIMETPLKTPGRILSDQKTFLHFACSDGYLSVLELQLQGKKRMPVADFLRGNKVVEE